jgi:hypothetical protein
MAKSKDSSLEEAWQLWHDCLNGDDENSLSQQIIALTYDSAIYHLILACRKRLFQQYPDEPPANIHFLMFIDRNFFESQASAIRRLAGSKGDPISGPKGTFSLNALIGDMQRHRDQLTRAAFLKLIDTKPFSEAIFDFDRLCGKKSIDRSPTDVIKVSVFDKLIAKIDMCHGVTGYVNKFIAHSSTPESRGIKPVSNDVTYILLLEAHKCIYQVTNFLTYLLYSEERAPLPIPSPRLYEMWDEPLFRGSDETFLPSIYNEFSHETEEWQIKGIKELWDWIECPSQSVSSA